VPEEVLRSEELTFREGCSSKKFTRGHPLFALKLKVTDVESAAVATDNLKALALRARDGARRQR
jgi:hypothetical protein